MTIENTEVTGQTTPAAPVESPIPSGPATTVGDGHASPDPTPSRTYTEADSGQLTPQNYKERLAKVKKDPQTGKFQSSKPKEGDPNSPPAPAAKALGEAPGEAGKGAEGVPAAAEGAQEGGEYAPPKQFTALGKQYDLPEWAQKAMVSKEVEDQIRPMFEKVQAFDHVQRRSQELYGKYTELEGTHQELTTGVQELRGIYSHAVESGNPLLLEDFFKKLEIPDEVVLNYALARAQLMQLDPAQQQSVLGNVQAMRDARTLRSQNANLTSSASSAESRAMSLELNSVLAKSEVAPIVQAFDSSPGHKPGDFWNLVRDHGELTHLREGRLLSPAQAVQEVLARFNLSQPANAQAAPQAQLPAAGAPAPAAAAPQGQPQKTPVVPQGHRSVPTIPRVQSGSGSPTPAKPRSIDELRKIKAEKFG